MYNITHKNGEDPMNGTNVMMVLECIPELHHQINSTPSRKPTVVLKTYRGEKVDILGTAQVVADYQGREAVLPVQVVKGEGPNLLGRDWLYQLKVSVGSRCNLVNSETNLEDLLGRH